MVAMVPAVLMPSPAVVVGVTVASLFASALIAWAIQAKPQPRRIASMAVVAVLLFAVAAGADAYTTHFWFPCPPDGIIYWLEWCWICC